MFDRVQTNNSTHYARYEYVIGELAERLRHKDRPRVLVFGSSYGHECLTVIGHMPGAQVVGCEIDDPTREIAQALHQHGRVVHVHPSELPGMGTYDAALCHSVFCHHPENSGKEENNEWSFHAFEQALSGVVDLLRPRGWLSLLNSEYRLQESALADRFGDVCVPVTGQVQLFDRLGRAIEKQPTPALWQLKE